MYTSRLFLTFISLLVFISSCSTGTTPPPLGDGHFSKVESIPSTNIATLNSNGSLLLAGTDQGVYKKQLNNLEGDWISSGLNIDSAEVVDFAIWNENKLLAAIDYSNDEKIDDDKPDLFKSNNGSLSWKSIMTIYELSKGETVRSAPDIIELSNTDPSKLFGPLSVSVDSGKTWSVIDDDDTSGGTYGFSEFLTIPDNHQSIIWTGGAMTIFNPYLAKSEDGGETWTLLNDNFNFNTETTVRDLIVHPATADRVLAGAGGAVGPANVVRKSTNGGQRWQTVLQGYNIRTLAHSARGQGRVYASGINETRSPFFAASTNFGDDWEIVEMEGASEAVFINDMISVMEDGTEVLYLGTTKGIYKYTFEE